MVAVVNPIYNNFLLGVGLHSSDKELAQGSAEVDFSLTTRTWCDTAKTVALLLLQIVLFPWGLYEAVRWCVQRLVMILQYPAQSWVVKSCFAKRFGTERLDELRLDAGRNPEFIVRHVTLEKDGTKFSGILLAKPETINNGKWVLQVGGNCATAEGDSYLSQPYQEAGYNTLLVNNPGVGRSEGIATPETIRQCQNTAIAYLKTALKAHRIVLAGYSLGGGGIGQAIEQYDFENSQTDFLVVRQMTFARASEMAGEVVSFLPECFSSCVAHWTDCEMDNVKSSEILSKHNIREIIIQGDRDIVIPLEYSLLQGVTASENRKTHILEDVGHNDSYPVIAKTVEEILIWDFEQDIATLGIAE